MQWNTDLDKATAVTHAYYEAEEDWLCNLDDERNAYLPRDAVAAFIDDLLTSSHPWRKDRPGLAWDVADDSELSGYFSHEDNTLHLHLKLAQKTLILHELAHWCVGSGTYDGEGHGAAFVVQMAQLVKAAFGEDEADALIESVGDETAAMVWAHVTK